MSPQFWKSYVVYLVICIPLLVMAGLFIHLATWPQSIMDGGIVMACLAVKNPIQRKVWP